MAGINKVILVGNLGKDPEVRSLANGSQVTRITIATSESWTDKQSGQKQERTEWHRVVFFNRLAEIAGEYLKKGSKVYVEGSLQTRSWEDQQGVKKYATEIKANEMQMLDSKGSVDNFASPERAQPAHTRAKDHYTPEAGNQAQAVEAFDDDIPF